MMNNMIQDNVVSIIATILGANEGSITIDTKMEDVRNWDSMRHVTIITSIEKYFNVSIPEEDVFDLDSVNAFVEEVKKLKEVQ